LPYVLGTVARRPVETSRNQVRQALLVLEELDDRLRVLGARTLPGHDHVRSLAVARRRVWLTLAALRSPPDGLRSWAGRLGVARQRASPRKVLLEPAVLLARAVLFLLRSVWRSIRAVVRLVYTLRAIWP
jgi:hypothetical protein